MKKIVAVVLILSLSLVGCSSGNAKPSEATSTKQEAAVVEEKPEEPVETAEAETSTEEVSSEPEEMPAAEETKESEAEPVETAEAETSTEEVSSEPEEPEIAVPEYVIDKYIEDGDFTDFEAYGAEMGSTFAKITKDWWNVDFAYNGYIVTVGTNLQDAEFAYIGICPEWDPSYVCLFNYIGVPTIPVSRDGSAFIPTEMAHALEDTINYMKEHPDPNTKPEIPGMDFQSWAELVGG